MEGETLPTELIRSMIENTSVNIDDMYPFYNNNDNNNNNNNNNNDFNNNNFYNNMNNNNNINNNNMNNNYIYESTPSPYSDASSSISSFSPPASPLSPSESLFQQLQNGKLTIVRDDLVDSAVFLKEMLELLYSLSTTQNIQNITAIQKHHPNVRQEGQFYLGQGFEKRGITKAKNSTNSVKFGGKYKQFCDPNLPYSLKYNFDSPPDCYKHLVVHQFFLSKTEEETGEKPTKKTKSEEKERKELPGLVNQELRLFVVLPSKNELKRKHTAAESKPAGWEANGDVLSTSNEVRVNNTVYANKIITPHNATLSDESTKENISSVDPIESLHSVLDLTISKFNYKGEFADPSVQNIGVMAQQVEQVLPGSTTKIEGSGKFDGKLAVNHNNVMYKTVSALQGLTLIVQCLVKALETHQIDTGKSIYKTLSTLGHSLPPLPNNVSPLDVLQKHNLLNPKKGDSVPVMNPDTSSKMVREFMIKTKHLYNCYAQDTKEVDAKDDERERDTENKKKPLERWKIIEERLQELVRQKQLLNAKWEVQCNGCETSLCTLADLHFFFVPEDQRHYLVSDDAKEWIENPTEESKIDPFTVAVLKCPCGQKLGKRVKNRGKGSPKRELSLESIVFVNTQIEHLKSFDSAVEALHFFSERLCLETRFTTREEELAEALEADRLKREGFPESTRIKVRPLSRVGAGTSASGSGRAIMCKRDDTIADLLEKIKKEFPNEIAEALYHNEDQVDVIDLKKYVNDVLRHDDIVYFGLLPQNEVLISLRMYQKELIEQAVKANRVVVCPTGSGKTAVALEVDRVLRSKSSNFKSVMVVRDLPLSVQQYTYFRKNTKLRVNLVNSERPLTHDWSEMLELENVVVLTAQVLLNKLIDNSAQLSHINLLILDEAHNTAKNHPFNCIMRDFYHKLPEDKRPHILALTASPPAHINLEMTKALIKNFEKSTDSKILLVDEYKVELRKDISIPRTVVHPINPSAYEKSFLNLVNGAMTELESKIKFKQTGEEVELQRELTRGSVEYEATCSNEELKFYNRVLLSFNDSVELAIEELKSKLDVYPSVKKILDGLQVMGNAEKTKLELFLRTLDNFKNVENFRGIVFVGTKLGGEMMKQAILNNKMDFLKPNVFFGHGRNGLGMSSNEQTRVISQFNTGEINLLIATSVAEEGLDLKACNVVFRYDSVYSHRSLIQTRGRARQKDSQFIIFYHTDSPAEKAWYGSMRKLKNMLKAVGEQLPTSPFMSEPIYIDMSGQVTIPKRIFPDDEDGIPAQELKEEKADSTANEENGEGENNEEDSEQEENDEEEEEEEEEEEDEDNEDSEVDNEEEDSEEEQLVKKTSKVSLQSPDTSRSESTHSNENTPISTSSSLPPTIASTSNNSTSTPPATLKSNLSIPPTPTIISHIPKPSAPLTTSIPSSTPSTPPPSTPPPSTPLPSTSPPSIQPSSTPPPSAPSARSVSVPSTPSTPIPLSNPSTPTSPPIPSTPTSPSVTDPMMLLNQKCQALRCKNPIMVKINVASPKEPPIWKVTATIYNKTDNSPVSFSAQAPVAKAAEKLVADQILLHSQEWHSGIPL